MFLSQSRYEAGEYFIALVDEVKIITKNKESKILYLRIIKSIVVLAHSFNYFVGLFLSLYKLCYTRIDLIISKLLTVHILKQRTKRGHKD